MDGRFSASSFRALVAVSLLWFCYLTFQYYWIFGGDPEIHIIFAKNFLSGHVLEFNPGFKSGGETSPVYMLMVAGLLAFMGVYVPYGMKALSFISFALLIYLLYRAANQSGNIRRLLFILLVAGLPFLQLQAYLGMENILFALIVLWVVTLHVRGELNLGLLLCGLPLMFFLRPEAVFVYAWIITLCLFQGRRRVLVGTAVSLVTTFLLYKLLNSYTGVDTHSAGMIRRFLSGLTAIKLDLGKYYIYISTVAAVRMLYVAPIFVLIILYRRALSLEDRITLFVLVVLPAVLHVFNILPNFHFARYFLFEFVVLFHVFVLRVLPLVPMRTLILVLWLPFMTMSVVEHYSRLMKFSNAAQTVVALKEESIRKYSDLLVARLGEHETPIVIASQEVQIRARLDDRFLVWSLDGVTDNKLANSLGNDYVDHFSYIKDRDIRYIFTPVAYASNPSRETLLSFFKAGALDEGLCLEGISLSSTSIGHVFKVNRCS
jgi:hypothetical protein